MYEFTEHPVLQWRASASIASLEELETRELGISNGRRKEKKKKRKTRSIVLETVIRSHDLILRVEITDVKLIRACLELLWWGETEYTLAARCHGNQYGVLCVERCNRVWRGWRMVLEQKKPAPPRI
jgi:hypothetical protein